MPLLDFPKKTFSFCGKVLEVSPMTSSLNSSLILMAFNMSIVTFCNLVENATFEDPVSVNDGSFYVATEPCQKKNARVVLGHGIVTG